MKEYKSKKQGFGECSFSIIFPKVSIVGSDIYIDYTVSYNGKTGSSKYIVKECTIIDRIGNSVVVK